jgi:hypothetical protein
VLRYLLVFAASLAYVCFAICLSLPLRSLMSASLAYVRFARLCPLRSLMSASLAYVRFARLCVLRLFACLCRFVFAALSLPLRYMCDSLYVPSIMCCASFMCPLPLEKKKKEKKKKN